MGGTVRRGDGAWCEAPERWCQKSAYPGASGRVETMLRPGAELKVGTGS